MSRAQHVTAYPVEAYEPSAIRGMPSRHTGFGAGHGHSSQRLMIVEPARRWYGSVMDRLNVLCALPAGWDGYRAQPVSFHNANFALRVLEWTCASELPAPSIVPGPNGDLQIEWHLENGDIELHIIAPNNVNAWRMTDRSPDDGEEVRLTNEFSLVARWIKELMEPAVAPRSAAA